MEELVRQVQEEQLGFRSTLRFRLTVWVVVIFAFIQGATGVVFWLYQTAQIHEVFDEQLLDRARPIVGAIREADEPLTPLKASTILQSLQWTSGVPVTAANVYGPDRTPLIAAQDQGELGLDGDELEDLMAGGDPVFSSVRLGDGTDDGTEEATVGDGGQIAEETHRRAVSIPVMSGSGVRYVVFLAADDTAIVERNTLVRRTLLLAGFVGVLASGFSGWYIAGIAVRPFSRLSRLAETLGPESLSTRLRLSGSGVEVQELTDQLDAARARINDRLQAQERFLSNISHELKTPIATLMIEAQTVPKSELSEAGLEFVETAEEEMRRLGKLIDSFLMLTRLESGERVRNLKKVSANDIIMDSFDSCIVMAEQYGVRLDPQLIDGEDDLDASVYGSEDLLRTMLDNLIRNAIRFSPEQGAVRIEGLVRGDQIVLSVQDQGQGIPQELLGSIFDRFARSRDEVRRGRGHGLGLAIAQGIAEMHGGKIEAKNSEEGGAVFTLTLPRIVQKPDDEGDEPQDGEPSG